MAHRRARTHGLGSGQSERARAVAAVELAGRAGRDRSEGGRMTSRQQRRALSLEELDDWLASDHAPAKGGWNVSAVDGFLAGIIVGPAPIEPKEWTRLIFGARPLGKDADAAI